MALLAANCTISGLSDEHVVNSMSRAFVDCKNESLIIIGVKAISHPYFLTKSRKANLKGKQAERRDLKITLFLLAVLKKNVVYFEYLTIGALIFTKSCLCFIFFCSNNSITFGVVMVLLLKQKIGNVV